MPQESESVKARDDDYMRPGDHRDPDYRDAPGHPDAPISRLRLSGLLSRTGIAEKTTLSPEGASHALHKQLIDQMMKTGQNVFCLSYHSPSLAPGNTPYVRTEKDLENFLATIDATLHYFFHEIGGATATPYEIYKALSQNVAPHAAETPTAQLAVV